jgi:hypothetical protein
MGRELCPFGCQTSSRLQARAECSDWLAKKDGAAFGPPKFCASADLLSGLLCDPAIGHRPHG